MAENYILDLIGALDKNKTKKQINSDLKQLEKAINMLRITGTFAQGNTKKELNSYIKSLQSKLDHVKLTAKVDSKNLKSEVDKALNNVSYKDIDLLDIDENKLKLKAKKAVADVKAFVDRNSVSVSIDMKREKLNNDLTAYLNRYSKIKESSVLLGEAEKVRDLIDAISDKKSWREASDSFQLFKSQVTSCGFATKSTTDRIKDMISKITKVGSLFGVASLAVSSFRKSLQTLKEVDTYLTEISKANDKLTKSQLAQIGNDSFNIASKYGKTATNYLSAVQEMSRAGYEDAAGLSELSVAVQGAGDMTQELANQYIIATDKAYKLGGSVEKLTEVLDGSNYITNHNAVNMTELAEGMSIVGSQAASLGVEVDKTTAVLGTMIATTQQSGSENARAFKAILLNLQQVTDEEEGITAEGLTKYEAACKALNVSLKETKDGITSLRDPMEVIKNLAEEYSKLEANDIRRTNLLSSVGGKLRANALNALLENYDMYEKMLKEYANGTGSMAAEAEKTANSWEGSINRVSNSIDSFVNSLVNTDTIIGGLNLFDKLIQGAEKLTDVFGEIPILITAINGTMTAMNKDYGITQLFNKETGKFDVQGNIFGINISQIKEQKKHFAEAEGAIVTWNRELLKGKMDINDFGEAVVQNNAQLKAYLATTSKEAPASLNGYKSYLNEAGVSTDALRLKTVLLNSAISFGLGLAIQFAIQGITHFIHATEEVRQKAQELGREFSNTKSDIESYKSQIEELYETINDSNSSIEDVTNARKTLMSVQDEMIDKFGTEKSVIDDVTDAINGQTEALDRLTQAKWQEAKNDYNNGGFWNGVANFLQGTNNIERMLNEYGDQTISFDLTTYIDPDLITDELVAKLENLGVNIRVNTADLQGIRDFNSLAESISDVTGARISLSGNAEEIYNQILALQNLISNDDSFDKLYDRLESTANSYKDLKDQYKEFYNQYILYEKILTDGSNYADVFKNITDAYEKYSDAFASGDKDIIKEATEKYASTISDAMATALTNGDADVADYFENMYPTLQSVVSDWKFNVAFDANTEGLQGTVQSVLDDLKDESGRQLTIEEILGLDEKDSRYRDLISIAHEYKMEIQELIPLLRELGLVSDMDYQGLVALFGQENIDSLTPEDIEIAYTINNVGDMTFDELVTDIQRVKDEATDTIPVSASVSQLIDQLNTQLKPTFDSLKSAYQDIFVDNKFNLNAVDISMLDSIKSDIKDLNNLEDVDININMDDFDTFAKILTDVNTTEEQAQQAFDDFATSIFNATFATEGMTDETVQLVEQLLESLGVVNANEVAQQALNEAKAQAVIASYDLVNASEEEYAALLDEAVAAGIATQQVYKLIAAEIAFGNNDLSVEQKIDKLHALASAYGDTASAALATAIANDLASGHTDVDSAINDLMTQINSGLSKVDVDFSGIEKSASKAGSSAGKSYAESFKDELEDTLSGITGLIDKQINAYEKNKDAAVKALEEERDAQIEAIEDQIEAKNKVIDSINDEIKAMQDANDERKRQLTLQQAQYDLERMQHQKTILQYSEEKGMHYVQDTSNIREARQTVEDAKLDIEIANREKQIDLLEKEIDLLEERKDAINDYYDKLIEDTENYWDSLIESLEEYKSRWEELSQIEENAKLIVALRKLGIETDDILNMSGEAFDNFKEKYLSALTGMYSGNNEMLGAISESMGEFGDSLPPVSQKIDTTADSMDNLSGSSSTASKNVSDTAENLNTASTNAGALSDNLTKVNTALSEEQIAFNDLKQIIDKVIDAINEKIVAIQEEQNAVGIATSTEISDFLLLRDKILEVKESINEVGTTVADLDLKTVDNITDSFQHLYDTIILVSDVLGSGIEGSGESVTNSISSAVQALNDISLEDGIIAQFSNLKIAIDDVTSAVGGGDRESSGSKNKSGKSGSGNSGSIGKGFENGSDSLTGSIVTMGETTQTTLGESGGEGAIGKFEEFGATIAEAEGHVQGVIDKLNEVDGMHSEATITINIETNGSIPQFAEGTLGDVNFESGSFTAEYGKAHAEGYNGLPKAEKNALVSEYGQTEMTVFPNGETVITDSPTMMDLPKGAVIFNEDQTKKILDNKLSVSGTAHSQGTDDGTITLADGTVLRPLQPGDRAYELQQKFNAYIEKMGGDVSSLLTPVNTIQRDMEQMVKNIETINNINNSRTQQVINQNITLNCPNVTNNSGIEYIQKELGHLSLRAEQEAMKH